MGTPHLSRRQALLGAAGVAAVVWASGAYRQHVAQNDPALVTLDLHLAPRELAPLRFSDERGTVRTLSSLRGQVVLLNVWATWCPPCREEMPALDRLQAALGGSRFEVVAVSIDAEGLPAVQAFFKQVGLKHLHPYLDSFHDVGALGAMGIPTTLLIDREGREIARKRGPATWDDPGVMQTIRARVSPTSN